MLRLLSFLTGFTHKRIAVGLCVVIIAVVLIGGAHVSETRPWSVPLVAQAQGGPSVTGPVASSCSSGWDSYEVGRTVTGALTYVTPGASHRCPTVQPELTAQDGTLPAVSLESVTPSPVWPGGLLTVTVRIDEPLPAEATDDDKITGGILVFDSW